MFWGYGSGKSAGNNRRRLRRVANYSVTAIPTIQFFVVTGSLTRLEFSLPPEAQIPCVGSLKYNAQKRSTTICTTFAVVPHGAIW